MANLYTYTKTTNLKKNIKGTYADGIITNDEGEFDVLKELESFRDSDIVLTINEKTDEDLA